MKIIIRDSYVRWRVHPTVALAAWAVVATVIWGVIIFLVMAGGPDHW